MLIRTMAITIALASAGVANAAPPTAQPWRAIVQAFALKTLKHPAWGYSHSQRDYAVAKALAGEDSVNLDDDVLFAAAYLHDIAAFPAYAKDGVDHADQAVELVGPILKDAGFPLAKLGAVQSAIRTHMYFRDPETPEARYLHDADALDWLGAIGVARVTALVDPAGGKPTGREVIPMLQDNLAKVPARVVTPAGQRMVPARRTFLQRYLDELRSQTADYATL